MRGDSRDAPFRRVGGRFPSIPDPWLPCLPWASLSGIGVHTSALGLSPALPSQGETGTPRHPASPGGSGGFSRPKRRLLHPLPPKFRYPFHLPGASQTRLRPVPVRDRITRSAGPLNGLSLGPEARQWNPTQDTINDEIITALLIRALKMNDLCRFRPFAEGKNHPSEGENYPREGKNHPLEGKNYARKGKNHPLEGKSDALKGKNHPREGDNYPPVGSRQGSEGDFYPRVDGNQATEGGDHPRTGDFHPRAGGDVAASETAPGWQKKL